jgi:branched-chain amino acid transport system ATP-binding protein
MEPILEVRNLGVFYGGAIQALDDVSINVAPGGFVALLGSNGAGKSTTLKTISGLLRFENGRVTSGSVSFLGRNIRSTPSYALARSGILHVREGRHVFANMTVDDNLDAAKFALKGRKAAPRRGGYDAIFDYFPTLARRRKTYAGLLSGGEQQMLAIGRALVGEPELLLVDEASLGLAPLVARDIFDILTKINQDRKLAVLVVEQNVSLALRYARYGYVIESGRIVLEGPAEELANRELLSSRYLGGGKSGNA